MGLSESLTEDRPRVRHNAEPGLLTLPQPGDPRNSNSSTVTPGITAISGNAGTSGISGKAGTSGMTGTTAANGQESDSCPRLRALLTRPLPSPRAQFSDLTELARVGRLQDEQQKKRARKQRLVDRYNAELWADCSVEERGTGKRQREENLSPGARPLQLARCAPLSPEGDSDMADTGAERAREEVEEEGRRSGAEKAANGGNQNAESESDKTAGDYRNGRGHGGADCDVSGAGLAVSPRGGGGQVATELDLLTLSDRKQSGREDPVGQ